MAQPVLRRPLWPRPKLEVAPLSPELERAWGMGVDLGRMPPLDNEHNHRWRSRMQFLGAVQDTAPNVFKSLRDGLGKLKAPYPLVAKAYRLVGAFEVGPDEHGRWEAWPPQVWRGSHLPSVTAATEAVQAWAAYWNLGDAPWLKSYALRLCAHWHHFGGKREALELMPPGDWASGQWLALPPLPESLPLWIPGGVWMDDPETFAEQVRTLEERLQNLAKGRETRVALPEQIHVRTPKEYLEVVTQWINLSEQHAVAAGWTAESQKRKPEHFNWLALRVCGGLGPAQIVGLLGLQRNADSVQEAVAALAEQLELHLPPARKQKRLPLSVIKRLGFKR